MLILGGVSLAVVAGLLFGGRIGRLGSVRVAWWWAGLAAFVAQNVALGGVRRADEGLAIGLIVGSHVALVLVALLNNRLPGARLLVAGLALNLACMLANGGLMPVSPETLAAVGHAVETPMGAWVPDSKDVLLPTDQTRLALLSDRYSIVLPNGLSRAFSIGDVLLVLGSATFVFATMTKEGSDAKRNGPAPARLAAVPALWE